MGAWGYKVFEDDSALDVIDELMETASVVKDIESRIKQVLTVDYIDYDDAHFAIVSAVIVDTLINGNAYFDDDNDDYLQWVLTLNKKDFQPLVKSIVEALVRVVNNSELKELWEENESEYDLWKNDKIEIQKRLSK